MGPAKSNVWRGGSNLRRLTVLGAVAALVAAAGLAAGVSEDDAGIDLHGRRLDNRIAYIPPQCFTRTRTEGGQGSVSAQNPCYVCHAEAPEPNQASQPELQTAYQFPQLRSGPTVANPWTNLFVDRRPEAADIDDTAVARYVALDNYANGRGEPALLARLRHLPTAWDADGDGRWGGYLPDAYFHFDAQGYDRSPAGAATGWRAFAYHPLPGAFMPTNGSFDDVAIRLPAAFRQDEAGHEDLDVYAVNLATVEALITRHDVAIDPVDERVLGVDLDHDGRLGMAQRVAYDWAPLQGRTMSYVGRARTEQAEGRVHLAAGLYPEGTEFLHSVRYLQVLADGSVVPAPRMKELRYARKQAWRSYSALRHMAHIEAREQTLKPDRAETFAGDAEHGLSNPQGWVYQGFIEDRAGRLRPQTFEETVYCMGCHTGLSTTEDGSFALPRKRSDGAARGWTAWSSAGAAGAARAAHVPLPDPLRTDGLPEFTSYLRANRAGDEFRANAEVSARFFDANGQERPEAFAALQRDVSTLLLPSAERAKALNKAYWLLVREQSFRAGRSGLLAPTDHVHAEIRQDESTGIETPLAAPRLAGVAGQAVRVP